LLKFYQSGFVTTYTFANKKQKDMRNKPINMLQIRRLLQLLEESRSKRFIAKELGISHNTVDAYEQKIAESGLTFRRLLQSGDAVLSGQFHLLCE
jgi:transposase